MDHENELIGDVPHKHVPTNYMGPLNGRLVHCGICGKRLEVYGFNPCVILMLSSIVQLCIDFGLITQVNRPSRINAMYRMLDETTQLPILLISALISIRLAGYRCKDEYPENWRLHNILYAFPSLAVCFWLSFLSVKIGVSAEALITIIGLAVFAVIFLRSKKPGETLQTVISENVLAVVYLVVFWQQTWFVAIPILILLLQIPVAYFVRRKLADN